MTLQARTDVPGLVDHLFRHKAGQMVSTLTRWFGVDHLALAEDVVQETLLKALQQWPYRGIPENPGGWLLQVARNHALDILRREAAFRRKAGLLAEETSGPPAGPDLDDPFGDDQLTMMFICCHPALPREAQVALTLKTVGGFGVPEIARAFLVPEPTLAQRLVRARRRLREAGVEFALPPPEALPARLGAVLEVLYLLFNEGYNAHQGEALIRHDLCAEAIRLASLAVEHPAGRLPQTHALLALMLLQASRLNARTDAEGNLLRLAEQDRSRWDARAISLGLRHLQASATGTELTSYHLQAGIAACHAVAPNYEATDWPSILADYDALLARAPSPVVRLNRAVALAMVHGPEAGLAELERLAAEPQLRRYHLLAAAFGELYERSGRWTEAAEAYDRALGLTANAAERRFLRRQYARCRQAALKPAPP